MREDNADLRLTEIGCQLGCVEDNRWKAFCHKREAIEKEQNRLQKIWLQASSNNSDKFTELFGQSIEREYNAMDLLRRPNVNYFQLMSIESLGPGVLDQVVAEQVEIQAKYSGYVERQAKEFDRHRHYEMTKIPEDFNYFSINGPSSEVKEKFVKTSSWNSRTSCAYSWHYTCGDFIITNTFKKREETITIMDTTIFEGNMRRKYIHQRNTFLHERARESQKTDPNNKAKSIFEFIPLMNFEQYPLLAPLLLIAINMKFADARVQADSFAGAEIFSSLWWNRSPQQ